MIDALDLDTDADSIPDADEAGDGDLDTPAVDTDADGTPDFRDADSEDDGVPDDEEAGDDDPSTPPVDTDEDGHENWMEDVAGTDPWDAGAHLRLSIQQTSGVPVAAFSSVSNRQYWIEARTNLLVGQWSRLTNAIPGTDAEIRVPLEPGARSRFLRVGVGNTQ